MSTALARSPTAAGPDSPSDLAPSADPDSAADRKWKQRTRQSHATKRAKRSGAGRTTSTTTKARRGSLVSTTSHTRRQTGGGHVKSRRRKARNAPALATAQAPAPFRHRGSSGRRTQTRPLDDDTLREGCELAGSGERLPSDAWRDGVLLSGGRKKTKRVRWGEGLRWEEGERDVGFTLRSIALGEPGYAVRVVEERRVERVEVGLEVPVLRVVEETDHLVGEAVAGGETGSDTDSGDEYDVLVEFTGEEADGWVPVMVAEEDDEGDDWMSLTGSWVMMGGAGLKK